MIEINPVALNVLACLANAGVREEISKEYSFKITPLENFKVYTNSNDFKARVVNDLNFDKCVKFTITRLSDDSFRLYLEKSKICHIAFYKKQPKIEQDLLHTIKTKDKSIIDTLKSFMVKYEIVDDHVTLYINPVNSFRQTTLDHKEEIIQFFNSKGKAIKTLDVKFFHNGQVVDEVGETLLDLGFSIQ